jgi:hypothetical protein
MIDPPFHDVECQKGPSIHHSGAITADETAFGIHYCGLQGLDGRWQRWRICLVVVAAAEPTDVKA